MATKFEIKSAVTRIAYRFCRDSCTQQGVFGIGLVNDVRQILQDQPPLLWQRNLGQNRL